MTTLDKIIQDLLKYQKNLENTDFSNPDEIKNYIGMLIKNLGHITRHTIKLHDNVHNK